MSLSISLNGSRIYNLLACHQAELSIRCEATADETVDPTDLNEAVKTTKREKIDAFSSQIIHSQIKALLLGNNMHVLVQTLKGDDGLCLPHSLSAMNIYNTLIGSK